MSSQNPVLRLHPLPAVPAPIEAASTLRHDPSRRSLQAVANTIRAFAHQGFAEQDLDDLFAARSPRFSPIEIR